MLSDKEKISIDQAFLLFITMTFSPIIMFAASYSAQQAKQAAWLSPAVSFIMLMALILLMHAMYKKHKEASFGQIIYLSIGNLLGKVVVFLYILFFTVLTALYTRYYAERLLISIMPNTPISLFFLPMLITVAVILRSDVPVLARMNQIFLSFITIVFFFLIPTMAPDIHTDYLTPISYLDIIPVLKGSMATTAIFGYLVAVFIFSDRINDKENIKKAGIKAAIFLLFSTTAVIVLTIGSLGYTITQRAQVSFFLAVKEVSAFNIVENIQSIIVAIWIISDFVIIALLTHAVLYLTKFLFNLSDSKVLINPFMLFMYFFALLLCNNLFELEYFSKSIAVPLIILFTYVLPFFIFILGKIRKKL